MYHFSLSHSLRYYIDTYLLLLLHYIDSQVHKSQTIIDRYLTREEYASRKNRKDWHQDADGTFGK